MIISILFILLIGLVAIFLTRKQYALNNNNTFLNVLLISMLLMHFAMTIVQYYWSLESDFDSKVFFQRAQSEASWLSLFRIGNRSISFFCYPLIKIGLNYLSISAVFSFIGYLGYLIYFKIITRAYKNNHQFLYKIVLSALFLMPSIHFWTGFLTKEAVLFFLTAIVYQQIKLQNTLTIKVLASLLLILFIRPYLALIILIILGVIYFKTISKKIKISIVIIGMLSTYLFFKFLKINNLDSFQKNYSTLIYYAKNFGNSSIDLENSNFLERLVLVLFRPMFFDAKTILHYYISIENTLIFLALINTLYFHKRFINVLKEKTNKFIIIYIALLITFFSVYMYNMGLANRMRVLFVPFIFILLIELYNSNYLKSTLASR